MCEEVLTLCADLNKCIDACLDAKVEPGLVKNIKAQVGVEGGRRQGLPAKAACAVSL